MIFRIYLAFNMLVAAFLPGARPRSTVSGYIGERAKRGCRVALFVAYWIDKVHYWEKNHCILTYEQEKACRKVLYHDRPHRQ